MDSKRFTKCAKELHFQLSLRGFINISKCVVSDGVEFPLRQLHGDACYASLILWTKYTLSEKTSLEHYLCSTYELLYKPVNVASSLPKCFVFVVPALRRRFDVTGFFLQQRSSFSFNQSSYISTCTRAHDRISRMRATRLSTLCYTAQDIQFRGIAQASTLHASELRVLGISD